MKNKLITFSISALLAGTCSGFAETWYFSNDKDNNNNFSTASTWHDLLNEKKPTSFNTTDKWVFVSERNGAASTMTNTAITIGDFEVEMYASAFIRGIYDKTNAFTANSLTLKVSDTATSLGFAFRSNNLTNFLDVNILGNVSAETTNTAATNRYLVFGGSHDATSNNTTLGLSTLYIKGDVSLKNYTLAIVTNNGTNATIDGVVNFDTGSFMSTNTDTATDITNFTQTIKVGGLKSTTDGAGTIGSRATNAADTTRLGVLEITGSDKYIYSGAIQDTISGGGITSITMNGEGMQFLSGTNTYTGDTTVKNGTLFMSTINSSSKVVLQGGAFGAVGDNALSINSLEWSGGGFAFDFNELNYTLSIGDISGAFDYEWLEDFIFDGITDGQSYTLLSIATANANFAAELDGTEVVFSDGSKSYTGTFSATENSLSVSFQAIPEPSTYAALLGAVALALAAYRRRK